MIAEFERASVVVTMEDIGKATLCFSPKQKRRFSFTWIPIHTWKPFPQTTATTRGWGDPEYETEEKRTTTTTTTGKQQQMKHLSENQISMIEVIEAKTREMESKATKSSATMKGKGKTTTTFLTTTEIIEICRESGLLFQREQVEEAISDLDF